MDVNSNTYTFGFAAAMVVVVAALLSFAATSLKPAQDTNIEQEKKQNILTSIKIETTRPEAEEQYPTYITKSLVIQENELKEGVDAFNVDMTKEVRKPVMERQAPLYIAEKEGETYFVIPVRGQGLWGPIWGYISLEDDLNTIYGAVFDHQGETPGLGAEITTAAFQTQFIGKEVLDGEGEFIGIDIRKGDAASVHQVDGISGGTITSDGVEAMIVDCLQAYIPFLKEYVSSNTTTPSEL